SHVIALPAWSLLLMTLGEVFAAARPVTQWYIEAHQFRIDTAQGIGRPTPEGAHRDGVDYVAVILVGRQNVRGGETRVFEAQGIAGVRFTMTEPWTTLLLDDERVIHETTPIQPDGVNGVRDTLVLTYRERGFQSPP
ncbi:MAG: 2OG-Fe dioxygenase family protein, partial [Povalibacter sp.]